MAILTVTKADNTVVVLPDPNNYTWTLKAKIGTQGTNQNGDGFKDVIASKREMTVTWGAMGATDMSTILNAIEDPYFQLTCPEPMNGSPQTLECECQNPTVGTYSIIDGTPIYSGLKLKFLER